MTDDAPRLEAERLSCSRGGRRLFSDIGFTLRSGEWLHVRGANGAGKTSLLRLLAGLSTPDSGVVRWNGSALPRSNDAFRDAVAYAGHRGALKDDLTALENLRLAAAIDGRPLDETSALVALRRLGLQGREDLPLRTLSAGQRRRVLLSRIAARDAVLWILDEPLAALDSDAVDVVGSLVKDHLAGGGLAVITSHQPLPLAPDCELAL